jgi:hypothetical protein
MSRASDEGRVLAEPLLREDGEKSGGEAEYQTGEPKAVHPDVGGGHGERCIGGGNGLERSTIRLGALQGDKLGEDGVGYSRVVWCKSLRCLRHESREHTREKAGLHRRSGLYSKHEKMNR